MFRLTPSIRRSDWRKCSMRHPPIVLTQARLRGMVPAGDALVFCLDSDWPMIAAADGANLRLKIHPQNLAYLIFTSGSTGRPKAAMSTTRICNRLLWMQSAYGVAATDCVLQKTPFSFDVSVWEFFWPLMTGAQSVVARPGGHRDAAYLKDAIAAHEITTLHFVPSMLRIFLDQPGLEKCRSLKRVIASGEALAFDLQQRFFSLTGVGTIAQPVRSDGDCRRRHCLGMRCGRDSADRADRQADFKHTDSPA